MIHIMAFGQNLKEKKSININLATCSLRLKSYNEKKILTEGNNKLGNSYCAQASVRVCTIEALVLNRSSRVIPDEAKATNKSRSLKTAKLEIHFIILLSYNISPIC